MLPVASAEIDAESPAVWSNSPNFIEFAQNYFDTEWFAASQMPERFDRLFSQVIGGFSYNQVITEPGGSSTGYIMLNANDAFLKTFNLTEDCLSKKMRQPFPGAEREPALLDSLHQLANGKITRFEYNLRCSGGWCSLLAFSQQRGYFMLVIKKPPQEAKCVIPENNLGCVH